MMAYLPNRFALKWDYLIAAVEVMKSEVVPLVKFLNYLPFSLKKVNSAINQPIEGRKASPRKENRSFRVL